MLPKNSGSIDVRRRQIDTLKIFNDKYVRATLSLLFLFLCISLCALDPDDDGNDSFEYIVIL